ncbi:O-antigen ligase family protein [Paenibacillus sp. GYB004]|uniref:O-antigen ligase family protein n=1 Tax=Paenibacillus sp. GYB004 TaxID=2994393 RepID=UPI002F96818B
MFYKLSKTFYILFIFYTVWFQLFFHPIHNAPLMIGMGMIGCLLLHKMNAKKRLSFFVTKPVFIWLIFLFYIFITGYFVAFNKSLLITSALTYFQTLIMMIYILDVAKNEGSSSFFVKSFALLSIFYSITLLFWGYKMDGRVMLSPSSNANSDGTVLQYGIFCLLVLMDLRKPYKFIISYAAIGMLLYAIVLTGSRKSFLFTVILILLWLCIILKYHWKFSSLKKKTLFLTLIAATLIVGVIEFVPVFFDSALYIRLTEGLGYQGDQNRKEMYITALDYFKSNPLLGIGFNQFRVLSPWGTYSHSTYAEIISTTGIIGPILYFIPYLIIMYNIFLVYRYNKQTLIASQAILYLVLMILMLFLATGVILFYDITANIMFALMISFYYISLRGMKVEFTTRTAV